MDLMASWLWKHLAHHGKGAASPEEVRASFGAICRESSATLLVEEPWMGTIRFKTLARPRAENVQPFLADPLGDIRTHYGGGSSR